MVDSRTGAEARQGVPTRTVASATFVGAFLEWYDFNLYAIAAPLVLNQLFFPTADPLIGTLAAFITFGIGFVFRPLGGFVFGHLGDKVGRKSMLIATLLIIGVSTFLVGVLPPYAQIGIWAPILLTLLRVVQGFGMGGEFGGAATVIVEHAPKNRRGFWGSLPQAGGPAGFLVGTVVIGLFSALLTDQQFLSWGWRVPFLLSIVLLGVGLFIRLKILETPAFRQMKERGSESTLPVKDLFRTYPRNTIFATMARVAEAGSAKIFLVFAIGYLTTQVGLSRDVTLTGIAIYNSVAILLTPVFGILADRVGSRRVYMTGLVLLLLYIFPYFWILNTGIPELVWLALALAPLTQHMMGSVEMPFLAELVGTRVRFTGLSVIYQLSAIIAGFLPAIFTALLAVSDGSPWLAAATMFGIAAVALVCTRLLTRTFADDLSGGATEEVGNKLQPGHVEK